MAICDTRCTCRDNRSYLSVVKNGRTMRRRCGGIDLSKRMEVQRSAQRMESATRRAGRSGSSNPRCLGASCMDDASAITAPVHGAKPGQRRSAGRTGGGGDDDDAAGGARRPAAPPSSASTLLRRRRRRRQTAGQRSLCGRRRSRPARRLLGAPRTAWRTGRRSPRRRCRWGRTARPPGLDTVAGSASNSGDLRGSRRRRSSRALGIGRIRSSRLNCRCRWSRRGSRSRRPGRSRECSAPRSEAKAMAGQCIGRRWKSRSRWRSEVVAVHPSSRPAGPLAPAVSDTWSSLARSAWLELVAMAAGGGARWRVSNCKGCSHRRRGTQT